MNFDHEMFRSISQQIGLSRYGAASQWPMSRGQHCDCFLTWKIIWKYRSLKSVYQVWQSTKKIVWNCKERSRHAGQSCNSQLFNENHKKFENTRNDTWRNGFWDRSADDSALDRKWKEREGYANVSTGRDLWIDTGSSNIPRRSTVR